MKFKKGDVVVTIHNGAIMPLRIANGVRLVNGNAYEIDHQLYKEHLDQLSKSGFPVEEQFQLDRLHMFFEEDLFTSLDNVGEVTGVFNKILQEVDDAIQG